MEQIRKLDKADEVIDLLWDSSSDENDNTASTSKNNTKRTASLKTSAKKTGKRNISKREKVENENVIDLIESTTAKKRRKSKNSGVHSFQVATYNVWFGPPSQHERMLALSQALLEKNDHLENPLWLIGFQEVTPTLWSVLKPILESAGYCVFCQNLDSGVGYGVALAVKQDEMPLTVGGERNTRKQWQLEIMESGWQPFRTTIMNRGFLYVRVKVLGYNDHQILFTTTHLESYVGNNGRGQVYTGSFQREEQLKEMELFCHNLRQKNPSMTLIMTGDLNWDDERIQSKGTDKVLLSLLSTNSNNNSKWRDTWLEVREQKRQILRNMNKNGKIKKKDEPTCYTYDAKESPMLGGNLRRRFDRVLISSSIIETEKMDLIGKEPIDGLSWTKESNWNGRITRKVVPVLPSDHFGYVVTLKATKT